MGLTGEEVSGQIPTVFCRTVEQGRPLVAASQPSQQVMAKVDLGRKVFSVPWEALRPHTVARSDFGKVLA